MELTSDHKTVPKEILLYLSPRLREIIEIQSEAFFCKLEEIRVRYGQPLLIRCGDEDWTVKPSGQATRDIHLGYRVNEEDIYRTIASISDNSLYAFEEDIRRGFITIPGGHRVGLAGSVIAEGDEVKNMKYFSGICFRVARQIPGAASGIFKEMCDAGNGDLVNTLIISPPRCGKTTILRDLALQISSGKGRAPENVVLVDERSELAGCFRGVPQLNVGPQTDVLDACPKAVGMMMAIRSLSPRVIICDEIGRQEDYIAVQECINAGVKVICSVHAGSDDELRRRPFIKDLLGGGAFKLGIVLSRSRGPGSIREIIRWEEHDRA
ncbi:MAG: stage III sporulation protein AA [Syntrophomonadaceae bacterium]|nr:stage III sporulation protein AA [Syntrophomonadaceae bacterium]